MNKKYRVLYLVLIILVTFTMTTSATYAYIAATVKSNENAVQTSSTIYSISMGVSPLYNGFSIIPMKDEDALKGLNNKCKDKYDRGACTAYLINVYGYNETVTYISGLMDITTNMQNISYMVLRESTTYEEDKCINIEEKNTDIETTSIPYCIAKDITPIGEGKNLSLGDEYNVEGSTSTSFILLIWLSNQDYSQNTIDIGSFNATITMQIGSGGQIKGSIADMIKVTPPIDNNNEIKEDNNA